MCFVIVCILITTVIVFVSSGKKSATLYIIITPTLYTKKEFLLHFVLGAFTLFLWLFYA
jgi:hypothetical protein